jgi:hypothetical protein
MFFKKGNKCINRILIKIIMKKLLCILILSNSLITGFGQYINPSGEWLSTTGNVFSIITTNNGIIYTNRATGNIINAGTIGINRYRADFYNGPVLVESLILTVLNENNIGVYNPAINQSQNWNRIITQPHVFTCGVQTSRFNFVYAEQQETNWCWAACIQMILNYYGINLTQSQIVYRTFGTNNWGDLPNWAGSIENIHENLNNWNIDNSGSPYNVHASFYQGAPNVNWLINELQSGHPVLIAYINGTSGHAVLITGCNYSMKNGNYLIHTLTVRDPWPGNGRITYNGYDIASRIQAHWYIRVEPL